MENFHSGSVRVNLKRVSVLKLSYLFAFSGLFFGLILGFPFFVLVRTLVDGFMSNVPAVGLAFLSFLLFPIAFAIFSWLVGLVFGFIFNLILKLVKGLEVDLEELG